MDFDYDDLEFHLRSAEVLAHGVQSAAADILGELANEVDRERMRNAYEAATTSLDNIKLFIDKKNGKVPLI